jgi:hypothetical protein
MPGLIAEGLDPADVITFGYRSERWNFVEGEAAVGILSKLNKEQSRYVLSLSSARVVWRTLLFYPGATLVRVTDLLWRPQALTLYFVGLRGQYRRLDGSRRFIQFMNEKFPLKLTALNVLDYLRFYCYFVRSHGRPFLLVEKPEDLGLFEPAPKPEQLIALASVLRPAKLEKEDPATGYDISAMVRYAEGLFDCRFNVSPQGTVKLLSEQLVGEPLPVVTGAQAAGAWA